MCPVMHRDINTQVNCTLMAKLNLMAANINSTFMHTEIIVIYTKMSPCLSCVRYKFSFDHKNSRTKNHPMVKCAHLQENNRHLALWCGWEPKKCNVAIYFKIQTCPFHKLNILNYKM